MGTPTKSNLKYHMVNKHDDGVHDCNLCPFTTEELKDFEKHIAEAHNGQVPPKTSSQKRAQCHLCSTTLSSRGALKTPLDAIHYGRKFFCDKCPFATKSRSVLSNHVLTK